VSPARNRANTIFGWGERSIENLDERMETMTIGLFAGFTHSRKVEQRAHDFG
jgi:hypothetical protein